MKRAWMALVLLASAANAGSPHIGPTSGAPRFPPAGQTALAFCAGAVCADGDAVVIDTTPAPDCLTCITGGAAWAAGTNGLFYNGDGVIVGPDAAFCGIGIDGGAGDLHVEDDMEIKGGTQSFCDMGADGIWQIIGGTADGSDRNVAYFSPAGTAAGTRGAFFQAYGNEYTALGGKWNFVTGNVATGHFYATLTNSASEFRFTAEAGATDEALIGRSSGWAFTGVQPTQFEAGTKIGTTGTVISDSYAGSATIDFAATTTTTRDSSAITVTGAALGDTCTVGFDTAATAVAGAAFSCYVSAADSVIVRLSALGAAIDPPSDTFRVRVFDP